MDQNKIDRLFREKMDNLEVMPSAGAWSQVEKQIRPKSSFKVYWAAAAVALIFASWLLWPSQADLNQTPIASEVTYPPILEFPDFVFAEIKVAEEEVEALKRNNEVRKAQVQLVAKDESKNEIQPVIEEITPMEIESKSAVAVAEIDNLEIIQELEDNVVDDFSSVKITYIASNNKGATEELQKPDSASAFKKFIAFAEKIDPGEMMAEFKSAKDNLLNNGFKKKEKNSL